MGEPPAIIHSLYETPFATALRESDWSFPIVQTAHILGVILFYGALGLVDLRLLGVVLNSRPARDVARALLPVAWLGFAVLVISGCLLFAAQADKIYNNVFFLAKLAMIALAGLNLVIFNQTTGRSIATWGVEDGVAPVASRISAALSLLLWTAVVAAGRFIAYFGATP